MIVNTGKSPLFPVQGIDYVVPAVVGTA
jgi:hypothetical protein